MTLSPEQIDQLRSVLRRVSDLPYFKNVQIEEIVRDARLALNILMPRAVTGAEIRAYQEEHRVGFYDAKAALKTADSKQGE
jgi:hypothetical protein